MAALKAKILTAGISEITPMKNIDVSIKIHIIIDDAFDCTVVDITSLTSFESIFDLARIDLSFDLKLKAVARDKNVGKNVDKNVGERMLVTDWRIA